MSINSSKKVRVSAMRFLLFCAAAMQIYSAASAFTVEKVFEQSVYYIKDASFINSDTGWAVGDVHWNQAAKRYQSTILRTNDGGNTWLPQSCDAAVTLRAVSFVTSLNGWACGDEGTIIATSDGGATWTKKTIATRDVVMGICFADLKHGWAVVDSVTHKLFNEPDGWKGSIWRTADGGATWTRQTADSTGLLHAIHCVDSMKAWAVGLKTTGTIVMGKPKEIAGIFHTGDGGQTWRSQFNQAIDVAFTDVGILSSRAICAVGFALNSTYDDGTVFISKDGGGSWTDCKVGGSFWDVDFTDSLRGYIAGMNYIGADGPPLYRTLDGGTTWIRASLDNFQGIEHGNLSLYAVSAAGGRVVALGDESMLCRSPAPWTWTDPSDNTFDQTYLSSPYNFEEIHMFTEHNGWVAGKTGIKPDFWGQVILNTTDGATWTTRYRRAPDTTGLFSLFRLNGIGFTDSLHGWAIGNDEHFAGQTPDNQGSLLHTADGGATWNLQGSSLHDSWPLEYFALQFLTPKHGWALAKMRFPKQTVHLVRTADAGATWEWVDTKIDGSLGIGFMDVNGDICFTDSLHGWACGGLGVIVHTGDGGATWTKQTSPLAYGHLAGVEFIDTARGWLGGEGELYYTTNGGAQWQKQNVGNQQIGDITDIHFTNDSSGWICGNGGIILHTSDGGKTWKGQSGARATARTLRSLSFTNDSCGWACGLGGTIVRITNSKDETVSEAVAKPSAGGWFVSAVRSPSGNSLGVSIHLPDADFVSAHLYTIAGKKIRSFAPGALGAGTHRLSLDMNGIAPGSYIISVRGKKMPGIARRFPKP